jgi:hypothetical protein
VPLFATFEREIVFKAAENHDPKAFRLILNCSIFDFDLSEDRMQLSIDNNGPLKDKLADNPEEIEGIIFGHGFGGMRADISAKSRFLFTRERLSFKGF